MPNEQPILAWHPSPHELLAPVYLKSRAELIRRTKPESEIELWLRLMKPVQGKLPQPVLDAWQALIDAEGDCRRGYYDPSKSEEDARDARRSAWCAWERACTAWDDAISGHKAGIDALHAVECPDCPWDGTTILPEGRGRVREVEEF